MGTVLGADLSLASSGLCLMPTREEEFEHTAISVKSRGVDRLLGIRDEIDTWLSEHTVKALYGDIDYIFLEGYSYNSRAGKQFDVGELGGVIKCYFRLVHPKAQLVVVPPTSLKKFTVGAGNAKKELMREWVYRKYGIGSETLKTNDEVDAFALCQFGRAWLDFRDDPGTVSKQIQKIMEKI